MVKSRELSPKPVFDESLLLEAFDEHQIKHKHAKNLWRFIIQNGFTMDQIHLIPDLPKKAAELLKKDFVVCTSKVVQRTDASDKSTTKLLIELQDGRKIETVIMRYGDVELRSFPEHEKHKRLQNLGEDHDNGNDDETGSIYSTSTSLTANNRKYASKKRATVCVSSQVGCAMGCKFCATGTMGLLANLTAGEIIEQLYYANQIEKVKNVVFMGMGEPLDNFDNVSTAVRLMTDNSMFALAASKITVSTVGIVPKIQQMIRDMPNVSLALSLHAPDQETRLKIVPTARNWDINDIYEAADDFVEHRNQFLLDDGSVIVRDKRKRPNLPDLNSNRLKNRRKHLLLEYVLIDGVNASADIAHSLGKLITASETRKEHSLLNVIPYNPTDAGVPHGYLPPSQETINAFVDIVRSYGVIVTIRQEFGQDVNAACGQLVVDNAKKTECSTEGDIEDLGSSSARSRLKLRQKKQKAQKMIADMPMPSRQSRLVTNRLFTLLTMVAAVMLMRVVYKLLLKQ